MSSEHKLGIGIKKSYELEKMNWGDVNLIEAGGRFTIRSIRDYYKLNKKIKKQLKKHRLDSVLLKVKKLSLNYNKQDGLNLDFVSGIFVKYAVINCKMDDRLNEISVNEFRDIFMMLREYSTFDPYFESDRKVKDSLEVSSSLLLRMMGSQGRFDIRPRIMVGRTLYLFETMVENGDAPDFIDKLVKEKFKEKYGLSLLEFIKIGFILYAASKKQGGTNRSYFKKARKQSLPVPNDDTINKCLALVTCDSEQFMQFCEEIGLKTNHINVYEFNPLFSYPLIRPWVGSQNENQKDDRIIAPIPDLVIYRFTTGLYYQLFNSYRNKFSEAFGYLFEKYVGKLLKWSKLPGHILSEKDIQTYLPDYSGKRPDWIVICEEGVVLIECKATKYSQDMFEYGLDATKKSCLDQIKNAIVQMTEFESELPRLLEVLNINYSNLDVQKKILTFENLLGLNKGPFREWFDNKLKEEGIISNWDLFWAGYLEEAQPYLANGTNFYSFIKKLSINPYETMNELISSDETIRSTGVIFKTQNNFFDSLLEKI